MQYPDDAKHIWAAYKLGYRFTLTFVKEDDIATYHFIPDPRASNINNVYCIQCSSVLTDPLHLLGLSLTWASFEQDYLNDHRESRVSLSVLRRYGPSFLYPANWEWSWDDDLKKQELAKLEAARDTIDKKTLEYVAPISPYSLFQSLFARPIQK